MQIYKQRFIEMASCIIKSKSDEMNSILISFAPVALLKNMYSRVCITFSSFFCTFAVICI